MKRKYKKLFAIFGLLVFVTTGTMQMSLASQDTQPQKVLKAGFFEFDGYHMMDAEGNKSGYGYEFLEKVADYENVEFEYLGFDSGWEDMLLALENGEIDVLTSARKTPEREKKFLFSARDIGTASTIMTVKADNQTIAAGDYETYDGISVAMLRGNSRNGSFDRFAREHGFTYLPVYYETEKGLRMALQEGTVAAAVTSNLRKIGDERIVEEFDRDYIYVITRKEDSDTMALIDDAIGRMDYEQSTWREDLRKMSYESSQTAPTETEKKGLPVLIKIMIIIMAGICPILGVLCIIMQIRLRKEDGM